MPSSKHNLPQHLRSPRRLPTAARSLSRLACAASMLLVFAVAPAVAEIYRWVDDGGVVNYTQRKPYGVAAQQISTIAGGPSRVQDLPAEQDVDQALRTGGGNDALPTGISAPDGALTDTQQQMLDGLKAAELARQAEVTRIRDANCTQARSVLERLQARASRLRIRDEDGNETVMAEAERTRRIAEAQRGVAANCQA